LSRTSKIYGYLFTIGLYLVIGPFFALPRLATTSFEIAFSPFILKIGNNVWAVPDEINGENAISNDVVASLGNAKNGPIAIGVSKTNGVFEISSRISKIYGYLFTIGLYLVIQRPRLF
jgi:branched-subunit amino acid permease